MKPVFEEEKVFLESRLGIKLPNNCWRKGSKIFLDCTCNKPIYIYKVEDGIIRITKDNTELFNNYQQKTIEELIEIYADKLNSLEEKSVSLLTSFIKNHENYYYVISHSGGKDSEISYLIWKKVLDDNNFNINWEIGFFNTTNDTADTYRYINKLPEDKLVKYTPNKSFFNWIINEKNYFVPSKVVRNCCSEFKENQINKLYDKNKKIVMVTGVRKYESAKRAEYDYIMDYDFREKLHGKSSLPKLWITFAPIVEWHDEEIWLYILKNKIEVNPQYYKGFSRCGCLICPYQQNYIDILVEHYYPKRWVKWLDVLENNYRIYHIAERLHWSLEEWQKGRWKEGVSRDYYIINSSPTKERIEQLANLKGISIQMAEKYFKRKCKCGKKLNPTEIAMNLKMYGREMDLEKMECRKCFCGSNNINTKKYNEMALEFQQAGCDLF